MLPINLTLSISDRKLCSTLWLLLQVCELFTGCQADQFWPRKDCLKLWTTHPHTSHYLALTCTHFNVARDIGSWCLARITSCHHAFGCAFDLILFDPLLCTLHRLSHLGREQSYQKNVLCADKRQPTDHFQIMVLQLVIVSAWRFRLCKLKHRLLCQIPKSFHTFFRVACHVVTPWWNFVSIVTFFLGWKFFNMWRGNSVKRLSFWYDRFFVDCGCSFTASHIYLIDKWSVRSSLASVAHIGAKLSLRPAWCRRRTLTRTIRTRWKYKHSQLLPFFQIVWRWYSVHCSFPQENCQRMAV